jgi:hypothetical protein
MGPVLSGIIGEGVAESDIQVIDHGRHKMRISHSGLNDHFGREREQECI